MSNRDLLEEAAALLAKAVGANEARAAEAALMDAAGDPEAPALLAAADAERLEIIDLIIGHAAVSRDLCRCRPAGDPS